MSAPQEPEPLYLIVVVNERTNTRHESGFAPDTHSRCCTLMSRMTPHPWRRVFIEPAQG